MFDAVHRYTCDNFAKYIFFYIHKALGIVFLKHPLILSLGKTLQEKFDFRKKVISYFLTKLPS